MTLIASDISKLRVKLMQRGDGGIWQETSNPAYDPVLRKPNSIQTRIQFFENWLLSKLSNGNAYILKRRDGRGVVTALYVLDPQRVQPLVSESGDVFYRLSTDNISGIEQDVIVPAREIIHDRYNCLFHPLIGLSPLTAAGLAAMQGVTIQSDSANFFANKGIPSGILTAPGEITQPTADRLKADWKANYSGRNSGNVAVLGDGLEFKSMAFNATDSQLIEQLKWTAEMVCSTFHVPPYKIGIGQMPTYNNIQALNIEYYSQGLQKLIEDAEICLDEGLGMKDGIGTEFDLDGLWRMDSKTQMEVLEQAKSLMTLDERRRRIDLPKMKTGGDTVYLQQQDHSLEAIAARDQQLIQQADNPQPPDSSNSQEMKSMSVETGFFRRLANG
ncbi:phage portal protein [Brucella intermedia]|uniref:phage portal protein n=1 Tax=Brucella intermedia TaxID=94625 RepID=UPI003B632547